MTTQEYIARSSALARRIWPKADVEVKMRDINYCGIRMHLSESLFIDVYYNLARQRKDFALIRHGERVFGIDNYGGWHVHPFGAAARHEPCAEPTDEEAFARLQEAVNRLSQE